MLPAGYLTVICGYGYFLALCKKRLTKLKKAVMIKMRFKALKLLRGKEMLNIVCDNRFYYYCLTGSESGCLLRAVLQH